jgi:hypothetical protein
MHYLLLSSSHLLLLFLSCLLLFFISRLLFVLIVLTTTPLFVLIVFPHCICFFFFFCAYYLSLSCLLLFPSLCVLFFLFAFVTCCNLNLGLVTKAKAYEGASQQWSPGVTFHAPGNVGECEGMNLHTPKWVITLGVGLPMDFQIFRERLKGSKPIGLNSPLYHWKFLGT